MSDKNYIRVLLFLEILYASLKAMMQFSTSIMGAAAIHLGKKGVFARLRSPHITLLAKKKHN